VSMSRNSTPVQIRILTKPEVKFVEKPWGWERWIADGSPTFRYALKEIFIKAPHKSSIQVHKDKQETNYIERGRGILHYSLTPIDVEAYLHGRYSQDELDEMLASLRQQELLPGTVFHIFPGFIHRVEASEDLTMIEASSIELDDVIRLEDDTGRGHGRIASEHKQ